MFPDQGLKLGRLKLEMWSLSHCTTREVLPITNLIKITVSVEALDALNPGPSSFLQWEPISWLPYLKFTCLLLCSQFYQKLLSQDTLYGFAYSSDQLKGFPNGAVVENPPAIQETWETQAWPLSQEDPLEEEMVAHSSILAWKISWTEGPGRLGHSELDMTEWLSTYIHNRSIE